jgi:hypothetical protein
VLELDPVLPGLIQRYAVHAPEVVGIRPQ